MIFEIVQFLYVVVVLQTAGLIISMAWGARGTIAVLAAAPVSLGVISLLALLTHWLPISWGLPYLASGAMVATALGLLVNLLVPERIRRRGLRHGATELTAPSAALAVLTLTVTMAVALLTMLIATRADLNTISQTWDALYHVNEVAKTTNIGQADPWTPIPYAFYDTVRGDSYYPPAANAYFSSISLICHVDAVVASNLGSILIAGLVWPSSMALLAISIFGQSRLTVVSSLLGSLGFWGMPWAPLGWGVLWPTAAGFAVAPLVLATIQVIIGPGRTLPMRLLAGLLLPLATALTFLGHPRGLFVVGVLAVPLIAASIASGIRRAVIAGNRPLIRTLSIVFVLFILSVVAGLVAIVGAPEAKITGIDWPVLNGPWQEVLAYLVNGPELTAPGYLFAVFVIIGIITTFFLRRHRWLLMGLIVAVTADVLAASVREPWAMSITRFWYTDRHRSAGAVSMISVLLVVVAIRQIDVIWNRASRRRQLSPDSSRGGRRGDLRRGTTRLGVATLVLFLAVLVQIPSSSSYLAGYLGDAAVDSKASLVSPDERILYKKVQEIVPPQDLILNNPRDGSAALYAYTGRRPVFVTATLDFYKPGVSNAVGKAQHLWGHVVTDPEHAKICATLDELGIRWILNGGRTYSTNAIGEMPAPGMQIPHGDFWLTTPRIQHGEFALYQITGCTGPTPTALPKPDEPPLPAPKPSAEPTPRNTPTPSKPRPKTSAPKQNTTTVSRAMTSASDASREPVPAPTPVPVPVPTSTPEPSRPSPTSTPTPTRPLPPLPPVHPLP